MDSPPEPSTSTLDTFSNGEKQTQATNSVNRRKVEIVSNLM